MAVRLNRWHTTASRRARARRGVLLAALALIVASGGALMAGAAVPTAPSNILIFSDRDFVSVEGFADHAGETATLEITRAGNVIGSAQAQVSGATVAFEVNHPGGVCWGNGTSLKVTPDIRPGDKATVSFGATSAGDATVQDAFAEKVAYDPASPAKVVVTGRVNLAAGIDPANVEQRIVNPDLVALIGKRDVRAVPGALTPAKTGGYSSGLDIPAGGTTFTATYVFDDAAVAKTVADGGGARLLTWQVTDAAGNRQGVTIAELGEVGGPGIGGCPAGPADLTPPAGTASVTRSADGTSLAVDWTAVTAQPGSTPVSGYSVTAIAGSASAAGLRQAPGLRTTTATTKATIDNLDAAESYTVEVRAVAGSRLGDPFILGTVDVTPPTLTADPAPNGDTAVSATSVTPCERRAGLLHDRRLPGDQRRHAVGYGQVVHRPDRDHRAHRPARGRLRRRGQPHAARRRLRAAERRAAGGASRRLPPASPARRARAGSRSRGTRAAASVTGYRVQTYDAAGARLGTPTPATDAAATIGGLTPGEAYSFTVAAKNANGFGDESAKAGPYRPTDTISITTARWKAGDFRITGSGNVAGATVTVRAGSPTAPALGSATVGNIVAPATTGTYDIRLRNGAAPATRPPTIYVTSDKGAVAGPFTVQ